MKSIESLEFQIPGPGVHLLSGSNGSGKTTLLACLRRIGYSNSFQLHFRTSLHSDRLDDFREAKVEYLLDDRLVVYRYATERWVPTPRLESRLIGDYGYPDVKYAGANADRITPRDEDFRPARMNPAPQGIRTAANRIFETDRFNNLRTINLTTGNRNQAFVLVEPSPNPARQRYISERNFSLGELCVLKLLRDLTTCRNGSLVVIDEIELALHPRAQIGLFDYLKEIAQEKALTVIVSTHSVTLLKRASRNSITFLEKREGHTAVLTGCFPSYALGNLSLAEERLPDVVVYVEDEAARNAAENLLKLAISHRYTTGNGIFPTTKVIPIGDFKAVVRFYDRNSSLLPSQVRQWILLDQDVESESVAIMAAASNSPMRDAFHTHQGVIRYLPWTPELGLIQFAAANRQALEQALRIEFQNSFINIAVADVALSSATGSQLRNEAKTKLRQLVASLCQQTSSSNEDAIVTSLYKRFTESWFAANPVIAMQLLAPVIGF